MASIRIDFPAPVKYGYVSVGVVEAGAPALRGREVFCLFPHQDRYVVPAEAVTPLMPLSALSIARVCASQSTRSTICTSIREFSAGKAPADTLLMLRIRFMMSPKNGISLSVTAMPSSVELWAGGFAAAALASGLAFIVGELAPGATAKQLELQKANARFPFGKRQFKSFMARVGFGGLTIRRKRRQGISPNALQIATQFAANHECEFDASDAVAAIIVRVEQTIQTLDRLCLEASQ